MLTAQHAPRSTTGPAPARARSSARIRQADTTVGITLDLAPTADTYISSMQPDNNFGSADTLRVYGFPMKPVFRFDLRALPPSATLYAAVFSFTFKTVASEWSTAVPVKRYAVYGVAQDFTENEATWKQAAQGTPWTVPLLTALNGVPPLETPPILASNPGRYNVDVTELVKAALAQQQSFVTLVLVGSEVNASGWLASREAADASTQPNLGLRYSLAAPLVAAQQVIATPGPVHLEPQGVVLPPGASAPLSYSWVVDKPALGSPYTAGQQVGDAAALTLDATNPGSYLLRLRVSNGDYGEAVVRVVTGLHDHPRLHLNDSLIQEIRSAWHAGDADCRRFFDWVSKKPTYSDLSGGLLMSYLLAHVITGERQYFDWAWDLMRTKVYKNGTDRSGGLTDLLSLYSRDSHSAAYLGGSLIAQVALLYDWGHAQLLPDQREDFINWMNAANSYNYLENGSARAYFRNDGAAVTYGLAAAAYATLGENPAAWQQLGWFERNWAEILQALNIMGQGGATGEGNAYGTQPTAQDLIYTADLVYHATGEDLFLSHPWFRQRLAYDAFAMYPAPALLTPGVDYTAQLEQASIGGDGRRAASWHMVNLRPNGLVLARHFAGADEAAIWNWVFRQPQFDHARDAGNSLMDVMFRSPKPALVKPSRLSHFDPSMGFVYLRSDWDSPDATWIAFWAGPHMDTHQHLDQGAFAIFKRRDLAPKTGHYDVNSISAPHDLAYYIRTISANTLLIGDPAEVFRGFVSGIGCDQNGKGYLIASPDNSGDVCVPNDGGQRTMHPWALGPGTAAYYQANQDVFETAKVVAFDDNGQAVSAVADLTNAYNNPRYTTPGNAPKVNKVYRRLVYLRDLDLLLVADTVETTNAGLEKKWLLHGLEQLQVGGDVEVVGPGETVHTNTDEAKLVVDDSQPSDRYQTTFDLREGYAALLVKTLFPTQFRYRLIGGRDPADTPHEDVYRPDKYNFNARHFHRHIKDFWVKDYSEGVAANHRSMDWMPESPAEAAVSAYLPVYAPGYGRWRLEVEPTSGNQTEYFLNVLKPTVNASDTLPACTRIETGDEFGAQISGGGNTYTVMFSKQTLDAPRVSAGAANQTQQRRSPKRRARP